MVSSFSKTITLVISPLAATMARWWQWQKQRSSCSLAVNLAFYCKALVQQHTVYQVTTHVKQPIWSHKQAACSGQKFWGNNFHGWGKIHENNEIYCPWKFPAIRYIPLNHRSHSWGHKLLVVEPKGATLLNWSDFLLQSYIPMERP